MSNLPILATSLFLSLLSSFQDSGGRTDSQAIKNVTMSWGEKIPLRDGTKLNATIYRPRNLEKPVPAIITITPYIHDNYHDRAMFFSKNGYVFLIVDTRGRGNSEGEFEPFANEGGDGHDVVEWAAKQKWCNGKVGMWGGSYAGFNQWSILKEFPPHLKTIVPAASAHPMVDFPAQGGIFTTYIIRWMTLTSGRTGNTKLFKDTEYWISKFQHHRRFHTPFCELDKLVGNTKTYFQKWVDNRTNRKYWDAMVPTQKDYSQFDIPILTISGMYDGDQPGAMAFYRRHMKYGNRSGKNKHYLIMGPWDHAGTRTPNEKVGGLEFSKNCLLDMNQLHLSWYDWALKGKKKPVQFSHRVIYFVTELGRWKRVKSLQEIPATRRKFYLNSNGTANDVFHSGTLRTTIPKKSPPDHFVYDPLDIRPMDLEKEKEDNYLTDQSSALNLFGNGSVYHSDPFPVATEITGYLKFVAWIKLNVPDTDFVVSAYEILPNGNSVFLTSSRLRARYRKSLYKEDLIKPGTINRIEFKDFYFISRRIKKGSRLRLVFRCPNTIDWEKNYNSGGRVECETRKDARTAKVTVYHDQTRPSYLEIPIVK